MKVFSYSVEKRGQTLLNMDEKEKEESFFQDLSFGTGGIRGILGLGPNRINIYNASGFVFKNKMNGVAISYDNRFGSMEFAYEAAKVLAYNGIKSYIFKALRPTPMLSFLVRHYKTSAGIMFIASHFPEYNLKHTTKQVSTSYAGHMKSISRGHHHFVLRRLDNRTDSLD